MTDFTIYEVDLDTQRPNPADNTKVLRGDPPRTAFSKYNDLLLALQGAVPHVGIEAPNPTVPFMKWFDTSVSPPVERYRNSANNAWLLSNPLATTASDGWMSKDDKTKLDGVQPNSYLLDRANHTGTQLASTISDFASASLAEIQKFGHGRTLGNTIADIDALRESGVYAAVVSVSTSSGLPIPSPHVIEHYAGATSTSAIQRATPLSTTAANQKRSFQRTLASNSWSPWFEVASIDSPAFTGTVTVPDNTFDLTKLKYITRAPKAGLTSGATWISHAEDPLQSEVDGANVTSLLLSNTGSFFARRNNAIMWNLAFDGGLQLNGPGLKISNSNLSSDANTLDFYEEGAFVPTLYGTTTAGAPTYASSVGNYTRIGDTVFWSAFVSISALGGIAGALRIGGMPFAISISAANVGGASVGFYANLASASTTEILVNHANGTSNLRLYKRDSSSTGCTDLLATDIGTTFRIYLSGNYKVA